MAKGGVEDDLGAGFVVARGLVVIGTALTTPDALVVRGVLVAFGVVQVAESGHAVRRIVGHLRVLLRHVRHIAVLIILVAEA